MDSAPSVCTVKEAAFRLRVSSATIRRLIATGQIPASRVGRSVRINRQTIERLVCSGGVSNAK